MKKFRINSPGINGFFYTEEDVDVIYNLLCKIKDVLEFVKDRPTHEKTEQFLVDAITKCREIYNIIEVDNSFKIK